RVPASSARLHARPPRRPRPHEPDPERRVASASQPSVNDCSYVDGSALRGMVAEPDVAEEQVEAAVVDAFERARDEEGGAEGAAEGGAGDQGCDRSGEVAG